MRLALSGLTLSRFFFKYHLLTGGVLSMDWVVSEWEVIRWVFFFTFNYFFSYFLLLNWYMVRANADGYGVKCMG